jgi:hypothetical protein
MVPLLVCACGGGADLAGPEATDNQLSSPLFAAGGIPADGNGNKLVFSWDFDSPVDCGGTILTLNNKGRVQIKDLGSSNNRNVGLEVYHIVLTYTNAAGDTWVWHDVGPDHYYVDGDELFVTISGRSTASGNIDRDEIVTGHVVLNLTTGEVVHVAGRNRGKVDDLACNALT